MAEISIDRELELLRKIEQLVIDRHNVREAQAGLRSTLQKALDYIEHHELNLAGSVDTDICREIRAALRVVSSDE